MGSRRALYGALRVNVLIHRGLREDAESGPQTPRTRHPVFVRRTSGVRSLTVRTLAQHHHQAWLLSASLTAF
jgi:hypothetical protein